MKQASALALGFIFASSCLWAAPQMGPKIGEGFWTPPKSIQTQLSWGSVKTSVQQRVMPAPAKNMIPVVTVTDTEVILFSKDSEGTDRTSEALQIRNKISKIYNVTKWKTAQRAQYSIFEGVSLTSGQMLKLMVRVSKNQGQKQISTSFATLDAGPVFQTYLETDLRQKEFMEKPITRTSFWSLIVPTAYAQLTTSDMNTLYDLWKGPNSTSSALVQTSNELSKLPPAIGELKTSISEAGSSLSGSLNETNKTLQGLTDPGTMAKSGAAFGLGMGVASTTASLITHSIWDLGSTGLRNLFYEIRGVLKPEVRDEILKNSENALKNLDPISKDLTELNMKLNTTLLALSQVDGKDPTSVALENAKRIDALETDIKSREGTLSSIQDSQAAALCLNEVNVLKKTLLQLKLVQEEVIAQSQGQNQCQEFNSLSRSMNSLLLRASLYRKQLLETIPLMMQNLDQPQVLEPLVSERKANNCSKDKINRFESRILKSQCQCQESQGLSEACQDHCDSYQLAKESYSICENSVQTAVSVRSESKELQLQKMITQNMKSLSALQKELADDFCRGSKCTKADNKFSQFSDNMTQKISQVEKLCRQQNTGADLVSKQVITTGSALGEKANESELPVSEQKPNALPKKPGEAPSFFMQLFSSVKKFFSQFSAPATV